MKRQHDREVGMKDLPLELVEMLFGYLHIKDVALSAALVCKSWHRLIYSEAADDNLWSIFYHRDIVELKDPLPYYDTDEEEEDVAIEDQSWKDKCIVACSIAPFCGITRTLDNGYLGLARKMVKDVDPARITALLEDIGSHRMSSNIINSLRCLVALGHSLHGPPTDFFGSRWRHGGFLIWAAAVADLQLLQFLCEFTSSTLPIDQRLDVNEQSSSDGCTPLHCLFQGITKPDSVVMDCTMLLLNHGADPTIANHARKDALQIATENGYHECAKAMIPFIKPKGTGVADLAASFAS